MRGPSLTGSPVALFTGGAPGAGKTSLLDILLPGLPLVSLDADRIIDELATSTETDRTALLPQAFELLEVRQAGLIAARRGLVVNTTAADLGFVADLHGRLRAASYRTMMAFVSAPLEIALARNRARLWPLSDETVRRKHAQAESSRNALWTLFDPYYVEIVNDADRSMLARRARPARLMLEGLLQSAAPLRT